MLIRRKACYDDPVWRVIGPDILSQSSEPTKADVAQYPCRGAEGVLCACISQLHTGAVGSSMLLSSLPHPEPPATALFHTRPQAAALGRSCCSRPHSASLCRSLPHSSAHYRNLPLPLCLPLRALFFAEASRALSAAHFSQSATHRSRVSCVVRCESRQYGGARLMAACGVQWPARSMGSIV